MSKTYGLIGDDGEILTVYHTLAELNGREYVELVENYIWEGSDYTDTATGKNYITIDRLAAAFNELCASTGMKKKALAQICGKDAATFSRYCSRAIPVPMLVWEKVKGFKI
jgi:hypothetical protein